MFSCSVSLAYRFRLFTLLLSNCDRSERRSSTKLKSLNEQNRTFLQTYSQFKCINMNPLSRNTNLNRQQSFGKRKADHDCPTIYFANGQLNSNWKFMDKKGLMAHEAYRAREHISIPENQDQIDYYEQRNRIPKSKFSTFFDRSNEHLKWILNIRCSLFTPNIRA